MKLKIIIAIFSIVTMSLGTSIVNAENNTNDKGVRSTDMRNEQVEKREFKASTTSMFKEMKEQKKVVLEKMRLDTFEIRKNALVKELNMSLSNMMKIREQLYNRIVRIEASTTTNKLRDMTAAKGALVLADEKLAKAKNAIQLFSATTYTASSTMPVASSTEIKLLKPRSLGNEAIKATKDARDSLKKVIEAISHSMGIKNENATTTNASSSKKLSN